MLSCFYSCKLQQKITRCSKYKILILYNLIILTVEFALPLYERFLNTVNFQNANILCQHGKQLPKFESVEEYEEFVAFTSTFSRGHHSYWLPIKRKVFSTWTWVNGSETFFSKFKHKVTSI